MRTLHWVGIGVGMASALGGCFALGDYNYDGYHESNVSDATSAGAGGMGGGSNTGGNSPCANNMCTWGVRIGDDESQVPTAMALAADQSVFVAGHFAGTLDLGNGQGPSVMSAPPAIPFLAKYDTQGTPQWVKALAGGPGTTRSIAVAGDKIVWVGTLTAGTEQAFVEITSVDGSVSKKFDIGSLGASQAAAVVISDDLNTAYIAGSVLGMGQFNCTSGDLTVNATEPNAFVMAIDLPNEKCTWVQVYDGGTHDAKSMFMTKDGNQRLFLAARYTGGLGTNAAVPLEDLGATFVVAIDMLGGTIFSNTNAFRRPAIDTMGTTAPTTLAFVDGKVMLAGTYNAMQLVDVGNNVVVDFQSTDKDAFLVGLDPNSLAVQFAQVFGGNGNQAVTNLAPVDKIWLYVAGIFDQAIMMPMAGDGTGCTPPGQCLFLTRYNLPLATGAPDNPTIVASYDNHAEVGIRLAGDATNLAMTAGVSVSFTVPWLKAPLLANGLTTDSDVVITKVSPPPQP